MSTAYERLDQAMNDLIEAYLEIQDKLESTHGDDEDAIAHGLTESLETSIESSIEEHDVSTTAIASMMAYMTDALEQLDPSAFDDDEIEQSESYEDEGVDDDIDDINLDDDDDDYDDDE